MISQALDFPRIIKFSFICWDLLICYFFFFENKGVGKEKLKDSARIFFSLK